MKTLIVEDEFTSRMLLQKMLEKFGDCHVAVNGKEAVEAVRQSVESGQPYDLICLDIMMPEMDGHAALNAIRELEQSKGVFSTDGVKVVMTTSLGDVKNITSAYCELCDGYLTKPIDADKVMETLRDLKLIPPPPA